MEFDLEAREGWEQLSRLTPHRVNQDVTTTPTGASRRRNNRRVRRTPIHDSSSPRPIAGSIHAENRAVNQPIPPNDVVKNKVTTPATPTNNVSRFGGDAPWGPMNHEYAAASRTKAQSPPSRLWENASNKPKFNIGQAPHTEYRGRASGLHNATRIHQQSPRYPKPRDIGRPEARALEAFIANKERWEHNDPYDESYKLAKPWSHYLNTRAKPWISIAEVGYRTGAFVQYPKAPYERVCYLWGSKSNRTSAVQALDERFGSYSSSSSEGSDSPPSRDNSTPAQYNSILPEDDLNPIDMTVTVPKKHQDKWAVLHSTQNLQQEARILEKEREREVQDFLNAKFDHSLATNQGFFFWPSEEMTVDEAFSNATQMEELNDIRRRCECYISYDRSMSAVRISPHENLTLGEQEGAIVKAIKAVRNKILAKLEEMDAFREADLKSILVQSPALFRTRLKIQFQIKESFASKPEYQVPVLTYPKNNESALIEYGGNTDKGRSNEARMRIAVKNILLNLRSVRARIQMLVNFGSFGLESYKKPINTYKGTVDEFRKIAADENTQGHLYPKLDPLFGKSHLVDRCLANESLFIPYDNDAMSLGDTKLRYSAQFYFPTEGGDWVIFDTTFHGSSSHKFEREYKAWYRKPTAHEDIQLDVNVIDFEKCAWDIRATTNTILHRREQNKQMQDFGECVHLRTRFDRDIKADPGRKFHYPSGNIPTKIIESTALRFRVARDPNYIFEVYQHATFVPEQDRFADPPNEPVRESAGWGARLYHNEWVNKFGENAAIDFVGVPSWAGRLTEFFTPSPNDPEPDLTPGDQTFHDFWEIVNLLMSELKLKGDNTICAEVPGQKFCLAPTASPSKKPNPRPSPRTRGYPTPPRNQKTTGGMGMGTAIANGVLAGSQPPLSRAYRGSERKPNNVDQGSWQESRPKKPSSSTRGQRSTRSEQSRGRSRAGGRGGVNPHLAIARTTPR